MRKPNYNPSYKQALEESEKYLKNPVGFTTYEATGQADQTILRVLNTVISLIEQLHNKVDRYEYLRTKEKDQLKGVVNDALSEQFASINISDKGKQFFDKKKESESKLKFW